MSLSVDCNFVIFCTVSARFLKQSLLILWDFLRPFCRPKFVQILTSSYYFVSSCLYVVCNAVLIILLLYSIFLTYFLVLKSSLESYFLRVIVRHNAFINIHESDHAASEICTWIFNCRVKRLNLENGCFVLRKCGIILSFSHFHFYCFMLRHLWHSWMSDQILTCWKRWPEIMLTYTGMDIEPVITDDNYLLRVFVHYWCYSYL